MSDATDVLRAIDQLRRDLSGYHGQLKAHNDLQRHCDRQRKRICELEGLYAKAKAEIAELREQTRWMAQTDARWEAAVRDCERAKADNAKLRELVWDLYCLAYPSTVEWEVSYATYDKYSPCEKCHELHGGKSPCAGTAKDMTEECCAPIQANVVADRMRELGVEVEG